MKEYITEAMILNELALQRTDAIDRCYSLGKNFIEHFHKVYMNPDEETINHWGSEMQAWYDAVRDITLKYNNKHLNKSQMKDWFYSFGSSYEEYFNNDLNEIDCYESFIDELDNNDEVITSLKNIFKNE